MAVGGYLAHAGALLNIGENGLTPKALITQRYKHSSSRILIETLSGNNRHVAIHPRVFRHAARHPQPICRPHAFSPRRRRLYIRAVGRVGQYSAKPAGTPLVEFEIQLPPGILLPDDRNISVTLWNGHLGTGCKVTQVRRTGSRPVVAGRFVAGHGAEQRLSLRLSQYAEGFWTMPVEPRAQIARDFGPWQSIEFQAERAEESPLPHGAYDVRYKVAKYL
jgi:hypothetical protein